MINPLPEQFLNALASGNAVHGYLIAATDLERAALLAETGAAILLLGSRDVSALKLHPDYFDLDGSIKIDELRSVRAELYKQAYAGSNRAVLIKNVHLMNDNAINAMLKMLEEPPDGTYFILTGIEQRVLPTIRSRCHIVRIGADSMNSAFVLLKECGASDAEAKRFALMSGCNEKRAVRLYEDEEYRELRSAAIRALLDMIDGKMPFKWAKGIGKDREAALESVEFMLSVCHDANRKLSGLSIETNADFSAEITAHFRSFTFSEIGGIIDTFVTTAMRLATNASVNLTLDGMIVRLLKLQTKV